MSGVLWKPGDMDRDWCRGKVGRDTGRRQPGEGLEWVPLAAPPSWISGLQNWEEIDFGCLNLLFTVFCYRSLSRLIQQVNKTGVFPSVSLCRHTQGHPPGNAGARGLTTRLSPPGSCGRQNSPRPQAREAAPFRQGGQYSECDSLVLVVRDERGV